MCVCVGERKTERKRERETLQRFFDEFHCPQACHEGHWQVRVCVCVCVCVREREREREKEREYKDFSTSSLPSSSSRTALASPSLRPEGSRAILTSTTVLQCVAVCCIVLQCIAVRCSASRCVADLDIFQRCSLSKIKQKQKKRYTPPLISSYKSL